MNYKGGRVKRSGYLAIRVGSRYVMEHRLVMEKHIGRKLTAQECVHHKNNVTTDNRIENLELCETHGQHTKMHHPEVASGNSIKNRGKHKNPETEFKKGIVPWNKGKKGVMPEPWNKGRSWTKNERKKLSESQKGKHTANNGSFKIGFTPWNKGLLGWKKGVKDT